ncbi:POU domain, class 2, transcription factor 3 isoform 2-T2 [Spinachia spinachia]
MSADAVEQSEAPAEQTEQNGIDFNRQIKTEEICDSPHSVATLKTCHLTLSSPGPGGQLSGELTSLHSMQQLVVMPPSHLPAPSSFLLSQSPSSHQALLQQNLLSLPCQSQTSLLQHQPGLGLTPQPMSRSGLGGPSMESHMDLSHLQMKHMSGPPQEEPSDLEELEQFAKAFKQRRIKLGFTQVSAENRCDLKPRGRVYKPKRLILHVNISAVRDADGTKGTNEGTSLHVLMSTKAVDHEFAFPQGDVGLAMGKLYGNDFSQTTISRFEALNLSFKNMCKLKPLLEKWLSDAENSPPDSMSSAASLLPPLIEGYGRKRKKRTSIETNIKLTLEKRFLDVRSTLHRYRSLERSGGLKKPSGPNNGMKSCLCCCCCCCCCFQNPKPNSEEITLISEQLSMEKEVVRVWFCNRRQKEKRIYCPFQPTASRPYSPPAPGGVSSSSSPNSASREHSPSGLSAAAVSLASQVNPASYGTPGSWYRTWNPAYHH